MTPGRIGRAVTLLVLSLMVASCTSTSSGSSVSTVISTGPTTTTSTPGAEATAAYVECLRSEGVTVDDIPIDADGRPMLDAISSQLDYSDQATVDAVAACAGILAEGALDLGYDDDYREAVVGQLAAFSRCVRARGVDEFPDPVPGFIGIGSPYPAAEIPYEDPGLPAAVDECQESVFGIAAGAGS